MQNNSLLVLSFFVLQHLNFTAIRFFQIQSVVQRTIPGSLKKNVAAEALLESFIHKKVNSF